MHFEEQAIRAGRNGRPAIGGTLSRILFHATDPPRWEDAKVS